jgi:hypothetical protein
MSKNLKDIPEIAVMWQAARLAIAEAESILFFGFSMPTSDELLVQMMRQAIRKNRKLRRVASIDLDPEAVIKRFEECVPSDVDINVHPFRVAPSQKPDWIKMRDASNIWEGRPT